MSLAIHQPLPLSWLPSATPTLAGDAITLLRALAIIDQLPVRHDDEQDERWRELEARVDLCLLMLGRLLARDGAAPESTTTALSGSQVSWLSADPPAPGSVGVLALYLSQALPLPLYLDARVTEVAAVVEGRWQVEAQFLIEAEELQDWLDKTVFRYHRREISQRKKHADDAA
ncbi:PilZ domain-containing protein [Chitinimonas lacunae]|uniref:PilZ domain-containing protein n=1 Tax=Chitinimonas lacunae TaxID=1963018 RepID=A0ABV8MTF9_9NEIS